LFRVDSGKEVGIGHVIRCIALAQQLTDQNVYFLCRKAEGNANALIESSGFKVIELEVGIPEEKDAFKTLEVIDRNNIATVIVDHYGLGIAWEDKIKSSMNLVVIDDYPDRKHNAHLWIDSGRQPTVTDNEYNLFGPEYCLLRKDFIQLRNLAISERNKTKTIDRILISFGGTDINGLTIATVNQLRGNGFQGEIVLLVASGIKNFSDIRMLENVTLHIDKIHVADILLDCDFSVGALGGSAWERCCMGLPSISIKLADNQNNIEAMLVENNATVLIESIDDQLGSALKPILNNDITWWKKMSDECFKLCDAQGAIRVAERVLSI